MGLGYNFESNLVNLGDTASLVAFITEPNNENVTAENLAAVEYTIQKPSGQKVTLPGVVESDGSGILKFNETSEVGHYVAVASFTLLDGSIKSTKTNFEVQDPFEEPNPTPTTEMEALTQAVWRRIEDCFDSGDGGPWLREMTLRVFNPQRMSDFAEEAVFDFNYFQPQTEFNLETFLKSEEFVNNPNPLFPVIVLGTFLAVIRHLMRSYVEQPDPRGGDITYEDRRDYTTRWETIYNIETKLYERWVYIAKRGLYGFGMTKTLVFSKSRASYFPGAPWRGRGWYPWP